MGPWVGVSSQSAPQGGVQQCAPPVPMMPSKQCRIGLQGGSVQLIVPPPLLTKDLGAVCACWHACCVQVYTLQRLADTDPKLLPSDARYRWGGGRWGGGRMQGRRTNLKLYVAVCGFSNTHVACTHRAVLMQRLHSSTLFGTLACRPQVSASLVQNLQGRLGLFPTQASWINQLNPLCELIVCPWPPLLRRPDVMALAGGSRQAAQRWKQALEQKQRADRHMRGHAAASTGGAAGSSSGGAQHHRHSSRGSDQMGGDEQIIRA